MGAHNSHTDLDNVILRSYSRCGTVQVTGRYHRPPKALEDDYELPGKVLGSGYNGQVFLATDRHTGKQYAVKNFKLHGVGKEKKEELISECEIFLAMDHPHVARLTDIYETTQSLNLVMECCSGGEMLHRVLQLKRFPEQKACEASRQILLALNYIHSQQVVHRDIKLENFLYDTPDSDQLKLIDFGFSKIFDHNTKMKLSCGTLSYVAPEVLRKSYTVQCDMWSFGVVVFVLLAGYMPFAAADEQGQIDNIMHAKYNMSKPIWKQISATAIDFINKCLVKDPGLRLSSKDAMEHEWIAKVQKKVDEQHFVDASAINALQEFAQASHFRRACMSMMAWSLSNEDRLQLRDLFLEMDTDRTGTVSLVEFKRVLEDKFHVDDHDTIQAFAAIGTAHTDQIRYSDFLAAMVSSRIAMHDDLLYATFHRFDTHNAGYITLEDLRAVVGESFDGAEAEKLLAEADTSHDGKISYTEFIVYLRGQDGDHSHAEVAHKIIDTELARTEDHPHHRDEHKSKKGRPVMRSKMPAIKKGIPPPPPAKGSEDAAGGKCCAIL